MLPASMKASAKKAGQLNDSFTYICRPPFLFLYCACGTKFTHSVEYLHPFACDHLIRMMKISHWTRPW